MLQRRDALWIARRLEREVYVPCSRGAVALLRSLYPSNPRFGRASGGRGHVLQCEERFFRKTLYCLYGVRAFC